MRCAATPGRAASAASAASSRPRARNCAASWAPSRRWPIWPRASAPTKRASSARSSASTRSSPRRRWRPATTSTARRCRPCSCRASRRRPTALYEQSETRDRVRAALAPLPARERKIIGLYYFGEATMKQIGDAIGVNESRVSQLHARAIQRLKQDPGLRACPHAADGAAPMRRGASTEVRAAVASIAFRRRPRPVHRARPLATPTAAARACAMAALRRTSCRYSKRSRGPRAHEIAQPERLRDPAAAALFEKPLGFGAGDVAGHEDQRVAPSCGIFARELAEERHAVDLRHLQVADDHVVVALAQTRRAPLRRSHARSDRNPSSVERRGHRRRRAPFVLDDQQRARLAARRRRRCCGSLGQRGRSAGRADRQLEEERRAAARLRLAR